ncbi:MAG TPA: DnaJ domain-containing protein [Candidatus Angelobacter sp.]|nr:DnaJ domain-containing protein [Candidatus Angelobacter sp.]
MATQAKRDYYEVPGVSRTATEQEINAAFQKLAEQYHSQGKPTNIEAVEHFREIVRAYHVLGDTEQRRRYDQFGENGIVTQPLSSGYDPDALELLARSSSRYGWPTTDALTQRILDKLFDEE